MPHRFTGFPQLSRLARVQSLPSDVLDEELLLEALRAGNQDAYRSLYVHYLPRVVNLCRVLLRDAGVEDAVQETFLKVFRNIQSFRGESRLTTWIHRIATNVCLTELRRRGVWKGRETGWSAADSGDPQDTEAELMLRQAGQQLHLLLEQLEPLKRTTFFLHHVEGLTALEIGEVLDEQRGTVLKRLQRTREDLLERWSRAQGVSSVEAMGGGGGRR